MPSRIAAGNTGSSPSPRDYVSGPSPEPPSGRFGDPPPRRQVTEVTDYAEDDSFYPARRSAIRDSQVIFSQARSPRANSPSSGASSVECLRRLTTSKRAGDLDVAWIVCLELDPRIQPRFITAGGRIVFMAPARARAVGMPGYDQRAEMDVEVGELHQILRAKISRSCSPNSVSDQ